ncbi:MAG: hypothetical protein QOJ42_6189 [Acidobacteriaceae bacterium]|jgi:hypothetical protein|nr:hypothetical protein [Acidobacteriaceae bacterium]
MAESHVISALVTKRAKLAGDIAKLDKQVRAVRARIAQVDGCLRLFGYEGDPRDISPIKTKGVHLLRRGRLQRTVLDITREAAGPLTNRAIAAELIRRMGWAEDDGELLDRVAVKIKDVTKRVKIDC